MNALRQVHNHVAFHPNCLKFNQWKFPAFDMCFIECCAAKSNLCQKPLLVAIAKQRNWLQGCIRLHFNGTHGILNSFCCVRMKMDYTYFGRNSMKEYFRKFFQYQFYKWKCATPSHLSIDSQTLPFKSKCWSIAFVLLSFLTK